jgi:hypothetical protein
LKTIGALGLSAGLPVGTTTAASSTGKIVPPGLAKKAAQKKLQEVAGTEQFEAWSGAKLGKRQPFYMLAQNGATRKFERSAYVYPVKKGNESVGYITASAQRGLAPIMEYSTATPPMEQFSETATNAKSQGMRSTGRPVYHGGTKYELELANGRGLNVRNGQLSRLGETSATEFEFDSDETRQQWKDIDANFGTAPSGGSSGGADTPSCDLCDHVSGVPCWTSSDDGGANSTDFGTGKDSWQDWDGCTPIAGSMIVGYHENISEWQDNERERIIDKLHETMNTGEGGLEDPGITSAEDIAPGFDNYNDGDKSYDGTLVYGTDEEFVLEELGNKSRPYLLSFLGGGRAEDYPSTKKKYGDHSVTVVGQYDFVNELEIHDTWNGNPHRLTYRNWTEKWSVRVEAN